VFYTTAVGGSTPYPEGESETVYVCYPGNTEWHILSDVMKQVSLTSHLEAKCSKLYKKLGYRIKKLHAVFTNYDILIHVVVIQYRPIEYSILLMFSYMVYT
jgi:hypothetical protein